MGGFDTQIWTAHIALQTVFDSRNSIHNRASKLQHEKLSTYSTDEGLDHIVE